MSLLVLNASTSKESGLATYVGIGFSKNLDTLKAAQEAAEQAKKILNQDRIDVTFVFNTIHYSPEEFLPRIYETLNKTKLVGSSTAGIILPERIETRGLAVMALHSDDIKFETSHAGHLNLQDIRTAGADFARSSLTDYGKQHRKLFFFFADGLLHELANLTEGVRQQFGNAFPIVGVGSSDDFHFKKTYQYFDNTFMSTGASGVLFGGRAHIGLGCRHGWRPLGKPRIIDDIKGHIINTIDGQPAVKIYEEYFATEAQALPQGRLAYLNSRYPLGMAVAGMSEYLLRNVMFTFEDGSMGCQHNILDKTEVHIMIGGKDSCLRAAQAAAEDAKEQMQGRTPRLILIFESLIRYKILGRTADEEIRMVRNILGADVPTLGMYSFGEIFTFTSANGTQTLLQNGSIMILAVC